MKKGKSTVLIGLQYGDEGKARVLDKILGDSDVVGRFNGGANAGHTLESDGIKIILNQIPSGIFYPDKLLYIGSGCVLNPEKLNNEKKRVESFGISLENRLFISGNVTLIQPHHLLLDRIFGKDVGTTMNGIGPAYSDQALRAEGSRIKNIKLGEYLSSASARENAKENLIETNLRYNLELSKENIEESLDKFDCYVKILERNLSSDPLFLEKLVEEGKEIFFEGAQSVMLDSVTGTTPYVTSSRTVAAAAYTGGDLSIKHHHKTIGVAKAIMSRVGNGPFISEYGGERSEKYCAEGNGMAHVKEDEFKNNDPYKLLKSEDMFEFGKGLRMLGGEYGATTKRPRRIGILDLVMLRQNCMLNGVDELYINKFDSLGIFNDSSLPGIPLVCAYSLDGKEIDYVPSTITESKKAKPIISYLPKFSEEISSVRDYRSLPTQVKELIGFIEEKVKTKICGIGVGPERNQFVQIL
ncbi:Adenylosuccinate synthetase [uncultured archaeon]|nr:Adenylosuccinate synthetase [uncultured archaeon]